MAPFRRQRQPKMTTQALLDLDLGESSSDSDFRIDDYASDNSKDDDDDDGDGNSSSSTGADDDDDEDEDDDENGSSRRLDREKEALEELAALDGDVDDVSLDSTIQLKHLLSGSAGGSSSSQGNVNILEIAQRSKVGSYSINNGLQKAGIKSFDPLSEINIETAKKLLKAICCVCLGDRSDDFNEIVECDGCGVSVHEGCYGVSDNTSISSTNSTCSTEPWFCEACRAGVLDPMCELCPNKGGIYKETDVGKWVHLVCALYIPGVAFGEVDQLSCVTLFEMQYSKWGSKACSLCENPLFARTGVCIGCDAGMCKTYFHVTCAQAAGFLTEAHHDEADVADPFYAHCKMHSEKELMKKRKRNFCSLRLGMEQKMREHKLLKFEDESCPAQMRIQRKLQKYQRKYSAHKQNRPQPWVPTQKMSRLLTTSAGACRRLLGKAEVMDVDVDLMERQQAQISALIDIRKKWHIAPAFSVEFIAYYMDRMARTKDLKQHLSKMIEQNVSLAKDQVAMRQNYDVQLEKNKDLNTKNEKLIENVTELQKQISALCPNKNLPNAACIACPQTSQVDQYKTETQICRPMSVPTAAALKMGVGFPLAHLGTTGSKYDTTRCLSTEVKTSPTNVIIPTSSTDNTSTIGNDLSKFVNTSTTTGTIPVAILESNNSNCTSSVMTVPTYECGICKKSVNQHLLVKCDICQLHYHLGCLSPPLTRHPKKSKLYGWQCSECDKSDESDQITEISKGPRKSRTRFNKQGKIVPIQKPTLRIEQISNNSQNYDDIAINKISEPHSLINILEEEDLHLESNWTSAPYSSNLSLSPPSKKSLKRSLSNSTNTMENDHDIGILHPAYNKKQKESKTNFDKNSPVVNLSVLESTPKKKVQKLYKQESNFGIVQQNNETRQRTFEHTENRTDITDCATFNTNTITGTKRENDETDDDPLALPITLMNNTTCISESTTTTNTSNSNMNLSMMASSFSHEVAETNETISLKLSSRKQKRKEKHRDKRPEGNNDTDGNEKSTNREHKRKRKKKQYEMASLDEPVNDSIPKIKIKFKTLPLPGEVTPEAHFFYVPASMVRSAEDVSRPTSVETVEDIPPIAITTIMSTKSESFPENFGEQNNLLIETSLNNKRVNTKLPSRKSRSRKATSKQRRLSVGRPQKPPVYQVAQSLICCICQDSGTSLNAVTCDECRRHYHFTCLEPPLKKSPKIRGYSWHCADCDPTDVERI